MAIDYGASAIGLVSKMPSGPGVIADTLIHEIAKSIPPPIGAFLLTSERTPENIIQQHKITYTNTIQIVDKLINGSLSDIKYALPAIKLVQVIHVIDENSVEEAIEAAEQADAILLDSGNPNLKIKELGGTGRTHDWSLSRKIRESIRKPLFLAGGITPENVRQALDEVEPFGIDLCSGVRTDGKLDEKKLDMFMHNVFGR